MSRVQGSLQPADDILRTAVTPILAGVKFSLDCTNQVQHMRRVEVALLCEKDIDPIPVSVLARGAD